MNSFHYMINSKCETLTHLFDFDLFICIGGQFILNTHISMHLILYAWKRFYFVLNVKCQQWNRNGFAVAVVSAYAFTLIRLLEAIFVSKVHTWE